MSVSVTSMDVNKSAEIHQDYMYVTVSKDTLLTWMEDDVMVCVKVVEFWLSIICRTYLMYS